MAGTRPAMTTLAPAAVWPRSGSLARDADLGGCDDGAGVMMPVQQRAGAIRLMLGEIAEASAVVALLLRLARRENLDSPALQRLQPGVGDMRRPLGRAALAEGADLNAPPRARPPVCLVAGMDRCRLGARHRGEGGDGALGDVLGFGVVGRVGLITLRHHH